MSFKRSLWSVASAVVTAIILLHLALPSTARAQATIQTGSILGTVTDKTGAVISGALVTIVSNATGQAVRARSSGTGVYNSGPLQPGVYKVTIEAKGFKKTELNLTVSLGVAASGDVTLEVGSASMIVEVTGSSAPALETSQATVQGTVTPQEIEQLPINGRNFLDLASLEPGVQIQDGTSFDPTKTGFSSVSFAGRFGRTARIEEDGIDLSDETVGTTTMNIAMSGIQEFQVEQSSLDMSTELTSSGAININSKAGTNAFHGEGFFYGRWHNTAARIGPTDLFWRRDQWGLNFGGPIIKEKVFFFADWERNRQDLLTPVLLAAPFTALTGSYNGPFREHILQARLDWVLGSNWRAFGRALYNRNTDVSAFTGNSFSPFLNQDNTPDYAAGLDGTTGKFTHSIRFGYLHFDNAISDAVSGGSIFNPAPQVEIAIGGGIFGSNFASGPNLLAPQATLQHDKQIKYDGSVVFGSHILRYGAGVNDIQGGGFAKFFGIAPDVFVPSVDAATQAFAAAGPFPGGASNPLNYPATVVIFGNGQGFFTEIPKFGFPGGGQFDTRFNAYVGDTWKVKPNLTFIYGLHYVRDTGRSDSDLAPIAAINQFGPGLGNRVHQPNLNFSPIVGLAWDPGHNGKTVLRMGGGVYYENAIFNNVLFDRPGRLKTGLFFGDFPACPVGSVPLPGGGSIDTSGLCGQPIGSVAAQLGADQQTYQAAVIAAGPQANGAFVGNTLAEGADATGDNLIGPNYRSPRSYQLNAGVERRIGAGGVLSVDYVRNVGVGYLLAYDTNHVGDTRFLNTTAATNAISATNSAFGCGAGSAGINCAITNGASIVDYASFGLDSGRTFLSGLPASGFGLTPAFGAAFPGINPNVGENFMLFPIGRSVYDGLHVSLRENISHPFHGAKSMSLKVSYSLSRAVSQAEDQDFINTVTDQRNINHFIGPNGLDRTHQVSFGGVFDLGHNFRASYTSHVSSPLPTTLAVPSTGAPGDVFVSDLTGDGTVGDVLSGTNIGSFGRGVKVGSLNSVITNYNNSVAGTLTPAGQALVSAGLFTQAQLISLKATAASITPAPSGQVPNTWYKTTDLQLSYLYRPTSRRETLTIEPRIGIYNLFNQSNWGTVSGVLDGSAGSADGTTKGDRVNRITLGTGLFGFGAPRAMEWGVRISF